MKCVKRVFFFSTTKVKRYLKLLWQMWRWRIYASVRCFDKKHFCIFLSGSFLFPWFSAPRSAFKELRCPSWLRSISRSLARGRRSEEMRKQLLEYWEALMFALLNLRFILQTSWSLILFLNESVVFNKLLNGWFKWLTCEDNPISFLNELSAFEWILWMNDSVIHF